MFSGCIHISCVRIIIPDNTSYRSFLGQEYVLEPYMGDTKRTLVTYMAAVSPRTPAIHIQHAGLIF